MISLNINHQAGEHSLAADQHHAVHEEHHQAGELNQSLAAHQHPAVLVHEEHHKGGELNHHSKSCKSLHVKMSNVILQQAHCTQA